MSAWEFDINLYMRKYVDALWQKRMYVHTKVYNVEVEYYRINTLVIQSTKSITPYPSLDVTSV